MEYVRFGATGLQVSRLCLGCMTYGSPAWRPWVLDEAANVCRWRDLPNLYSHYGSRGIILMTILQSWSQGVEVWVSPGCASSGAPRTSRSTVAASMRTPL